jgi:diguanylate cyclase (GGDEF)-like protein
MNQHDLRKHRNGHLTQMTRLLRQYGIEEGVRRIVERGAELEAANKQLEKDLAAHKRIAERLRQMALTDELTGLYNRRGFLTLAEQQFKMAHRMRIGVSLVYIDVDELKRINDTFGHDEGSAALRATGDILRRTFRDSDIIARIGGDEFIVLVMQNSSGGSESIADRLQQEVADHNAQRNHPYTLSLSTGIAYLDPKEHVSIERIMAKADEEMYKQKRSRRFAAA